VRVLWAPWRLTYIEKKAPGTGCIFCESASLDDAAARRRRLVLAVTEHACVLMNLYPYASAHLLIAPRRHTADFAALDGAAAAGVHDLLRRAVRVLAAAYSPVGFNIGMNLGRSAGAGIADHLHWHVVPRWEGDTNFMPLLAETRVMPQHLEETYDRLLPLFEEVQ